MRSAAAENATGIRNRESGYAWMKRERLTEREGSRWRANNDQKMKEKDSHPTMERENHHRMVDRRWMEGKTAWQDARQAETMI